MVLKKTCHTVADYRLDDVQVTVDDAIPDDVNRLDDACGFLNVLETEYAGTFPSSCCQ